jgi:hypothetical protein
MRAAAGFGVQNRRNCSMPRPPLSGSTALTGMHARPTSRFARLPTAAAAALHSISATSLLHVCPVSTSRTVCEFGTLLPAVHSIRDSQSFQHRTLTPVHACSLGIRDHRAMTV